MIMDLNTRSRSNTPSLRRSQRIIENTTIENKRVVRSQKKRYVTSDYSSEESETISDNTKNLIREELAHSSTVNGNGEVSALKLYKEAGEYWNKYPKTDYTYSRHSKDRVELAPGVVVMPNMSRRSLRNFSIEDKEILEENSVVNNESQKKRLKPLVLFPNKNGGIVTKGVSNLTILLQKFVHYFIKITMIVLFPVFYFYNNFQKFLLYVGKILHRMASRIMLWDTWILQKNVSNDRKLYGVLSLCLMPLIIFGGLWVVYAIITGLTTWMSTLSQHQEQIKQPLISPQEFSTPSIKTSLSDTYEQEFDKKMNNFLNEIENLKRKHMFLQEEIIKMNQKNSIDIKKCCRRSSLEIEGYIQKVLSQFFGLNQAKALGKDDIERWFKTVFVAKNDLEAKIDYLTSELKSNFDSSISHNIKVVMDEVSTRIKNEVLLLKLNQNDQEKNKILSLHDDRSLINEDRVRKIVSDALSIYDADKTGLVDYAMESAGGHIISTRCTQIYHPKTAVISVFGIPIWYPSNTPRTVITPGNSPGQCWAFQNFPGFLVIKLIGFVKISGFTMEHVSVKLTPNEKISSAPKDFEVYGLKHENDLDAKLLGRYRYLNNGKALQFFSVDVDGDVSFDLVELKVFSNHGNPNYTCLYRFRVHGELIDGSTS